MERSTGIKVLIAGLVLALVVGCGRQEQFDEQVMGLMQEVVAASAECQQREASNRPEPVAQDLTAAELSGLSAAAQAEYLRGKNDERLYELVASAMEALQGAKEGPCDKPYRVLVAYIDQYGEISAARLNLVNRGLMMAGIPLAIFANAAGTAMIVDKATGNTTTLEGVTLNAKQIGGGSTGEGGSLTGAPMAQNIGIGSEQIVPSNFGGNMNQGGGTGNFGDGVAGRNISRPINAQDPDDVTIDSTGFGVSPP